MSTEIYDHYLDVIGEIHQFSTVEDFSTNVLTVNSKLDQLATVPQIGLTDDQQRFVATMDHVISQCIINISNALGAAIETPETALYGIAQDTVNDIIDEFKDAALKENAVLPSEEKLQWFLEVTKPKQQD